MSGEPRVNAAALWFAAVVLGAFASSLAVAYLDEDAFISFRVVDNAVHGYGLRWNVDERVQVFTNPAWVLALIPVDAVLNDISASSFLLSAVASTVAVAWVAWRVRQNPLLLLSAFVLPLALSQAFTDYTNSGLENPFLYLGIALFAERVMRPEEPTAWLPWCLFASFLALTRLDAFLLVTPTLAWALARDPRQAPLGRILLGATPVLVWLVFALFYYGSVFPNPKYAKLNGGIDSWRYLELGGLYFLDVVRNDTVTALGLLAALAGVLSGRHLPAPARMLCAGSVLYGVYVVGVGGDFMAGRYWSAPFFLTVVTGVLSARGVGAAALPPLIGLLLAARFVVQPLAEEKHTLEPRENGRFAVVRTGGIRLQRFNCGTYEALFGSKGPLSAHEWSQDGLEFRRRAEAASGPWVVINGNAGKTAFFAGPAVTIIDPLGLGDALLARLPDADGILPMAGHLRRALPEGYRHARETGDTQPMDPELRVYYEALRSIISDPLLDPDRLRTLVRMNLGAYDGYLEAYIARGS